MRDMNKKGFVFTGMAFLLIVPAVLLVASLTHMIKTGDKATVTAIRSDTVFYVYNSVQKDFEDFSKSLVTVYGDKNETIRDILRDSWAPTMEEDSINRFGVNISIDEGKIAVLRNQSGGANYILIGSTENISWGIPINITDLSGNILLSLPLPDDPTKGLGPLKIGYADPCPRESQTTIEPCKYSDDCPKKEYKANITVKVRNTAGDLVDADSVDIVVNTSAINVTLTVNHIDTGIYQSDFVNCTWKNNYINITATVSKSGCSPSSFEINRYEDEIEDLSNC